jgi:hypothetical protein
MTLCHLMLSPFYPTLISALSHLALCTPEGTHALYLKGFLFDHGQEETASHLVRRYGYVKAIEFVEEACEETE